MLQVYALVLGVHLEADMESPYSQLLGNPQVRDPESPGRLGIPAFRASRARSAAETPSFPRSKQWYLSMGTFKMKISKPPTRNFTFLCLV